MAIASQPRNTLVAVQTRRLQDYILANRDDLEANPHEWGAIAAAASAQLGFTATDSNVKSACEVVGVKPMLSRGGHNYAQEMADLRRRIVDLEGRMARVEKLAGVPAALAQSAGTPHLKF